jgi:hypothetical protein
MTKKYLTGILLVLISAVIGMMIFIFRPPIPHRYVQQAGFGIWYPTGGYKITAGSFKVAKNGQDTLATFQAEGTYGKLGFTEQAEPSSFIDVPDVYTKLISKLQGYSSFTSTNGKVDLTRPVELRGQETAVMDSKGTLIFVKPDRKLTDEEWRRLFNSLQLEH